MRPPILYVTSPLDRIGHKRKDEAWIAARLADPRSRFVPFWQGKSLVVGAGDTLEAGSLSCGELPSDLVDSLHPTLLGVQDDIAYFAVELSDDDPSGWLPFPPERSATFHDLRAVAPRLSHPEASLLAYAKGLLYWHARHRFCGVCGSPTRAIDAGHVRQCTNEACKTNHFPRTDSAVIMLVAHGDDVLLGRQPVWPPGMYSVLAGFVEPGETLEAAVAREVFEETGILVEDVRYQASQPWPFPGSIMLGFRARAVTTEIRIAPDELQDARWVSRQWLRANPNSPELRVPPGGAIARRLLEDWLAEA